MEGHVLTPFSRAYCGSFILLIASATAGWAQPARDAQLVEVDPIRCWWRASEGAVAIGQPFSIVLTCAVVETDRVRVVPDETALAVGTIQLAPFEIVGGSDPVNLRSGQRRFFQREYRVRIIDPNVIGRDVALPALQIHYRVESQVQSQAVEGRERIYLLPVESVRILSMVPAEATDIRDGVTHLFGVVEGYRFRARAFDLLALALLALSVIVVVPAVVRVARGTRVRAKTGKAHASDSAVLGSVVAELGDLQTQGRGGWTADLLARALAATRVVAGYAIARPARQRPVAAATDPSDARIVVNRGWLRRQRVSVSSPTTSADLARALETTTNGSGSARLDRLRESLDALTSAVYGQSSGKAADAGSSAAIGGAEPVNADHAVNVALGAARELRREHLAIWLSLKRLGARE